MHYNTFDSAKNKWEQRKMRMDLTNVGVILSNWDGREETLKRFESVPFTHKVVFTDRNYSEYPSSYCLKGYKMGTGKNVWSTQWPNGKRFIDQFDYVGFINGLSLPPNICQH